jgi:hypothetical protein
MCCTPERGMKESSVVHATSMSIFQRVLRGRAFQKLVEMVLTPLLQGTQITGSDE